MNKKSHCILVLDKGRAGRDPESAHAAPGPRAGRAMRAAPRPKHPEYAPGPRVAAVVHPFLHPTPQAVVNRLLLHYVSYHIRIGFAQVVQYTQARALRQKHRSSWQMKVRHARYARTANCAAAPSPQPCVPARGSSRRRPCGPQACWGL